MPVRPSNKKKKNYTTKKIIEASVGPSQYIPLITADGSLPCFFQKDHKLLANRLLDFSTEVAKHLFYTLCSKGLSANQREEVKYKNSSDTAKAVIALIEIIEKSRISPDKLSGVRYQVLCKIIDDQSCWPRLLNQDILNGITNIKSIYSYDLKYEIFKRPVLFTLFLATAFNIVAGPLEVKYVSMIYVISALIVCYFHYDSRYKEKDSRQKDFFDVLSETFPIQFQQWSQEQKLHSGKLKQQTKQDVTMSLGEDKKHLNDKKSGQESGKKPVEKSGQESGKKPVEKSGQESGKKPVEKSGQESVKKPGGVNSVGAQVNAQDKTTAPVDMGLKQERGGGYGRLDKKKTTGVPHKNRPVVPLFLGLPLQNTPELPPTVKSQEPDRLPLITQKKSLFDLLKVMPHGVIEGKPYYHGGIDTVISSDAFIDLYKKFIGVRAVSVTSVKGVGSAFHEEPKISETSDLDLYVELKQDSKISCKDIASRLKGRLSNNGNKSIGIHCNDGYDSVRFTFSIDVTNEGVTYVCSIDITIAKKPYSPTFDDHRSCSITNNSDRLVCQLDPMPALSKPLCFMPGGGVRFVLSKDPRSGEYTVTCKEWRQYLESLMELDIAAIAPDIERSDSPQESKDSDCVTLGNHKTYCNLVLAFSEVMASHQTYDHRKWCNFFPALISGNDGRDYQGMTELIGLARQHSCSDVYQVPYSAR